MLPATAAPTHSFTIRFNGLTNRIITDIEVFPAFDPAAPPDPPFSVLKTKALWDSGATSTFLSPETVAALNLIPIGMANINHAAGSSSSPTYIVNLGLPNRVGMAGVTVAQFQQIPGGFGVLLGMDIISGGDLAITNVGGRTCMTFRFPSNEVIDFVADANRIRFAGLPPNAPCPCGSGRKYKKCHRPVAGVSPGPQGTVP